MRETWTGSGRRCAPHFASARWLDSDRGAIDVDSCHASVVELTSDIVLGILELLRYHQRVLYVDIDVHHGDGVEEAFYTTDRVMTCSFHKYGEFFPGTGDVRDTGIGKGKGYAVNVPLRDGMSDANYASIFQPVITRIIEWYKPGAIVLQCGSDSLSGDRLGSFNLSMRGHAACVQFIKGFGLPLLMLGGGGYTVKSVSRTWAYETGLAAGVELGSSIPNNEYYEYYGPDYELDVKPNNMADHNTREYLDKVRESVFEMLRDKEAAPSVPLQAIPKLAHDDEDVLDGNENEDDEDPDERRPMRLWDREKQNENSLSDSEDEGLGGRRHRQSHRERSERAERPSREGSKGRRRSRSPRTPAERPDRPERTVEKKDEPLAEKNKETEQLGVQTETTSADIKKWAATVEQARDGDVEMKDAESAGDKADKADKPAEAAAEAEKPAESTAAAAAAAEPKPAESAEPPAEPSAPAAAEEKKDEPAPAPVAEDKPEEKKDETEPMDTDK